MTPFRARRRLFVALEITGAVASEVDGLRRAIGSSSLGRISPHLTLVPPVNVAQSDLPSALALLRSVAHEEPIAVELGPARSFSSRSPVLYLAVSDPSARIARLQRRLDAPPLTAPTSRPSRPFSAHVTLSSRMERHAIASAIELFGNFREGTVLSVLRLYEQHHEQDRHPWQPLADVLLGAGTQADRGGLAIAFAVSREPGPDAVFEENEMRRLDGGQPVAVIGREGNEVVAQALGATVGSQLVIEKWCVENARRGKGIGRALVRAIERAASGLGAEWLYVAASAEEQAAFLAHLGFQAVERAPISAARVWFAPRRLPAGSAERQIS